MAILQRISNWFALSMMVVAAAVLVSSGAPIPAAKFLLLATAPPLASLCARGPRASSGVRVLAMAVNWIGAVLVGSLAGAALAGIGETLPLFPSLATAAVLYGWNAVTLALSAL
jgi:hypothetical protein